MAAPASKTVENLSGTWMMNKGLSDPIDPILRLQGIGWFLRTAIGLSNITQYVKQYEDADDDAKTHIDIEQTASGGIKGTTELRTLDGELYQHADYIFGRAELKSRWLRRDELTDEFLKTGWLDEGDGKLVQSWVKSLERDWEVNQIWGFQEINGSRYHARNIVASSSSDRVEVRLIYDFLGESDA